MAINDGLDDFLGSVTQKSAPKRKGIDDGLDDFFNQSSPVIKPAADSQGFISEVGGTLAGGLIDYAETIGRAGRALPGGPEAGTLDRTGVMGSTIKWAEDFTAANPSVAHKDREGLSRWFHEGLRSVVTSGAAMLPGLAAGAAAGTALAPGIGTVVGAAVGAGLSGGSLFGLAEYDSMLEEARVAGVPEEEAEQAAWLSAAAEAGFEGVANMLEVATFGGAKFLTAGGKAAAKQTVKTYLRASIGDILKKQAKVSAIETGTELATAAVQTEARREIGLTEQRAIDGAAHAFGPAFVASLFFGSAGHLYNAKQRRDLGKVLENPEANITDRLQAVDEVAAAINETSPDAAKNWQTYATKAVTENQPIRLDENLFEIQERTDPAAIAKREAAAAQEEAISQEATGAEITGLDAFDRANERAAAGFDTGALGDVVTEDLKPEVLDPESLPEAEAVRKRIFNLESTLKSQKDNKTVRKNLDKAKKSLKKIMAQKKADVKAVAEKIASGQTEFSNEELQLQQNFPQRIELELRNIQQLPINQFAQSGGNIKALRLPAQTVPGQLTTETQAQQVERLVEVEGVQVTQVGAQSAINGEPVSKPQAEYFNFLTTGEIPQQATERSDAQKTKDTKLSDARSTINPETDDILKAISKLGGINKTEALAAFGTSVTEGDLKKRQAFGKPILRAKNGLSLDRMIESLKENGFLQSDADQNAFLAAISQSIGGKVVKAEGAEFDAEIAALDEERLAGIDPDEQSLIGSEFTDSELVESGYNELSDEELSALESLETTDGDDYGKYRDEIISFLNREVESTITGVEGESIEGGVQSEPGGQEQKVRSEKTPEGDQTKLFATPPTFGRTGRDQQPGVGKNDLDFSLSEPEKGLFEETDAVPLGETAGLSPTFETKNVTSAILPEATKGLLPSKAEKGKYYSATAEQLQEYLDKNGDGFLYRVTDQQAIEDGFDHGLKSYKHKFISTSAKVHSFTTSYADALSYLENKEPGVNFIYRVSPHDLARDFAIQIPSEGDGLYVHVQSPLPAGTASARVVYRNGKPTKETANESRQILAESRRERGLEEGKGVEGTEEGFRPDDGRTGPKDEPTVKTPTPKVPVIDARIDFPEAAEAPKAQKQPAKKEAKAAAPKIDDFGEVLEGARKHYADKLNDALKVDIATAPLAKSWPEPDYQKMIDDGADPYVVAMVRAMRDEVPAKGRSGFKLRRYVEAVDTLRGFAANLVSGDVKKAEFVKKLNEDQFKNLKAKLNGSADLYQAVGHDNSLKGIGVSVGTYSLYNGVEYKPAKTIWTVQKKAKKTAFSNWPTTLSEGDTRDEAIAAFKEKASSLIGKDAPKKETKFAIYSKRNSDKVFIGKKFGRNYIDLESFAKLPEARDYLNNNQEKLEAKLAKVKNIPSERKEVNSPRVGDDHRSGADVTPKQFTESFGFRGVQFGNYVEGKKRQQDLNEAYDALMDMAGVLGIPSDAISLNGSLGLAFGARGKGGKNAPKAHYEPGTVVINLTKRDGAGSLAHEWWHGIDNYFGRKISGNPAAHVTEMPVGNKTDNIRPEVLAAFRNIRKELNETDIAKRSLVLDSSRSKPYWSTPEEITARAFENYVIDKLNDNNGSNDYLANIVSQDYWDAATALGLEQDNSYPYLTKDESLKSKAAYQDFFNTVETNSTEKGVALFSRTEPSQVNTDTKAFQKWFGDSKVVDENGDPLVVYHGTRADISDSFVFDYTRIGEQGRAEGAGFYFTDDQGIASGYAGESGTVINAYMSIKNPIKFNQKGFKNNILKKILKRIAQIESKQNKEEIADGFLSNYGDIRFDGLNNVLNEAVENTATDDNALNQISGLVGAGVDINIVNTAVREITGHDGVITKGFSDKGDEGAGNIYVAFFPEQIKSTDNRGTFDPLSPDIFFRREQGKGIPVADLDTLNTEAIEAVSDKVVKVQSETGLPKGLQTQIADENMTGKFDGVAWGGKFYLVADNISSIEQAQSTLIHEARHHGLGEMLGDQKDSIMADVAVAFPKEINKWLRSNKVKDTPANRITAAEEVLITEIADRKGISEDKAKAGVIQRVLDAIRSWINNAFPRVEITEQGLIDLIANVDVFIKTGEGGARYVSAEGGLFNRLAQASTGAVNTTSKAFRKWFGDSKVVDESGDPLVVYHGTASDFESFDKTKIGSVFGVDKEGFFFTNNIFHDEVTTGRGKIVYEDESSAGAYAKNAARKGGAANIIPVFTSLQNPLVIDSAIEDFDGRGALGFLEGYLGTQDSIDRAKGEGHDGIIVIDRDIQFKNGEPEKIVIAFEPTQIKSVFNRGTFDPTSPNILFNRRDLTKGQKEAIETGGFQKQGKVPFKERIEGVTDNFVNKFLQGVVDQFRPLKDLSEKAWKLARMSKSSPGAMAAAFLHGRVFLDDSGAIDLDTSKKGMVDILKPLGDEVDFFFMWIAGNRSAKLKAEGKENLFTDQQIKELQSLNQGTMEDGRDRATVYNEAFKEFNLFKKSILDIARKSGLLNAEETKDWDEDFYVPFYRVLEETGDTRGPSVGAGLVKQKAFQKLKGGKQQLNDLLHNTLMNFDHLISSSLKNQAATEALKAGVEQGVVKKIIPEMAVKNPKAIYVRENGKESYYEIEDTAVFDSLAAIHYAGLNNPAMKALRSLKRIFTFGITSSPEFRVANLIRDTIQAVAVSPISGNVVKNLTDGVRGMKKNSETRKRLLAAGGTMEFGYQFGDDPDAAKAMIRRAQKTAALDTDGRPTQRMKDSVRKMWDWWQETGNTAENVNRAAIYKQLIDDGSTHFEAAFSAADMLDFRQSGAWPAVRFLVQSVPFLNARLQGLDKLVRSGVDAKQQKQFAATIAVYSMAATLLYLTFKDDDDWKDQEDWAKDNYLWFKLPGTDTAMTIPTPFEVGAIGTMAWRMAEQIVDNDADGELFAKRLWATLTQTFAFSAVPQAFQPLLDLYANRNPFTERAIEGAGIRRLPKTERKTARTTQLAVGISRGIEAITPGDDATISPVQIDYLVDGYLGWVGATAMAGADMILRPAVGAPERPTTPFDRYPLAKRFIKQGAPHNTKHVTLFYDTMEQLDQIASHYRELRKVGDLVGAQELLEKNRGKLQARGQIYNKARNLMSKYNRKIKQIRASSLSGDEKRIQIEALVVLRNALAKKVVERYSL